MRRAFAGRVGRLEESTRRALAIAALEDARPLGVLRSAVAHAGLPRGALDQAERDGLIAVADAGTRFRHPLVPAAILELVTESESSPAVPDQPAQQLPPH